MAGLEDAGWIGRPKADLVLNEAERTQLTQWARRAKIAQFLALRAKIVLRCAEGGTNQQAAADLGVDRPTVDRWRARFIATSTAPRKSSRGRGLRCRSVRLRTGQCVRLPGCTQGCGPARQAGP
ncbi:helix-turn-helix domain-containing protein, partial [[Kitasatospora] papulosa]|uniref:helix-turn-helix domain-containing protein n=1 Tax=[Kitasatospora] papulosa TaxID=1464011 RepID=UPI0036400A89